MGFKERIAEPYLTTSWSSIEDEHTVSGLRKAECILIEDLEWSKDSKTLRFEINKCKMEDFKLLKIEDAPAETITLNAVAQEKAKETPKKKKVKKTEHLNPL